jgi:hypothetical protein
MKPHTLAMLFVTAVCSIGCAGARTSIVANDASYPISLSRGLRDAGGDLVPEERRKIVGTFHDDRTAWGMLYSGVKLTPTEDISNEINAQIAQAGGDAVINLRVSTAQCGTDYVPVLSWIPIWPGCTNVHIRGDIVRVTRLKPAKLVPAPAVDRSKVASTDRKGGSR